MSSKKETPGGSLSRRGFMRGVSLSGGALAAQGTASTAIAGPGPVPITLQINGKPYKLDVEPRVTLLDALRDRLDLTGAKKVCDRGTCGACTVTMNGKAVYSCSVLAIDAQGKDIQTIESLSSGTKYHPLITAFVQNEGQQCGYCTPGFVMAAKDFLDKHPNPSPGEVGTGLGGNICRCGTYVGVRKAVLAASREMKGGRRG